MKDKTEGRREEGWIINLAPMPNHQLQQRTGRAMRRLNVLHCYPGAPVHLLPQHRIYQILEDNYWARGSEVLVVSRIIRRR